MSTIRFIHENINVILCDDNQTSGRPLVICVGHGSDNVYICWSQDVEDAAQDALDEFGSEPDGEWHMFWSEKLRDLTDVLWEKYWVRKAYESWTESDIEAGDTDDRGWIDEDGTCYGVAELCERLLEDNATPSSSPTWSPNTWWTVDLSPYRQDDVVSASESYFLIQWPEVLQRIVYDVVTAG